MKELFNEFAIASLTIEIDGKLREPKLSIQKDWKIDFDKEHSSSDEEEDTPKIELTHAANKKVVCLQLY